MKPSTIRLAKIVALGLVLCALSAMVGVLVGEKIEKNRFEIAKGIATLRAQEYLDAGDVDKAISVLHFAKAFELRSLDGSTDGLLGKAYLAKGQPCMAESFFESNVSYMERNGLTELLQSYRPTKELLAEASKACKESKRPPTSRP